MRSVKLKPIHWKESRGSCSWWPHGWEQTAGTETPVYWHGYLLGTRAQIVERQIGPPYWLLFEGHDADEELFFLTLTEARKHFESAVVQSIEDATIECEVTP